MSVRAALPGRGSRGLVAARPEDRTEVVVAGTHQIRIGPWRGSPSVAYLAHVGDGPTPSTELLRTCLSRVAAMGFREVVTSAVAEGDIPPFLAVGFQPRERLHLLAHSLIGVPSVPRRATRRARPADHGAVLGVDARAFQPFWQLDSAGLADALGATPTVRYRVTQQRGAGVTGYAVFGLAGRRGYLQRLAVDPTRAGGGLGSLLVNDGLRWLAHRGATSALVNTQESNSRAFALYQHLGFVPERYKLVVMAAAVPPLDR